MLYLMMDKHDDFYLVKVGLSRDVSKRRRQYRTHNPLAIMRSECAGTEQREAQCHSKLIEWGAKRVNGTEWFYVSEELFKQIYKEGMGAFFPKHSPIYLTEVFDKKVWEYKTP